MRFCIIIQCALLLVMAGCSADDPTRNNTFIPLTSIDVAGTYEIMADQTINQYMATGDFSGAYTRDITSEVSWVIADETIASVSSNPGSEGLVTALAPGDTSVTAIYGDLSGAAPVVVTSSVLAGIEITPQDLELQGGIFRQYEAAGIFSDDSVQDITFLASWSSSATNVATIDDKGLAETLAAGTTTITAAWQGIQAATGLSVTGASLTEIDISPEEAAIARGTTLQLEAEGTYSDGTTLDITDLVEWQSSDTSVGLVNTNGLATGLTPGEIEVSASFDADGGMLSATATLTVSDAVIESISLTPENSTIEEGMSQQFTATGMFSDDSEQDITELATWLTDDSSVGTIINSPNSRGLFVSRAAGETLIEATFDGVVGETLLTVE